MEPGLPCSVNRPLTRMKRPGEAGAGDVGGRGPQEAPCAGPCAGPTLLDRLSGRGLLLLTAFVFTFVQRRFYSKPYDRMNFLLPIGNMVYYADRVSNTKHLCVPRVNPARAAAAHGFSLGFLGWCCVEDFCLCSWRIRSVVLLSFDRFLRLRLSGLGASRNCWPHEASREVSSPLLSRSCCCFFECFRKPSRPISPGD